MKENATIPQARSVQGKRSARGGLTLLASLLVAPNASGAPADPKWSAPHYLGTNPGGVAIGPNGALYITTSGLSSANKRIWAIVDFGTNAQTITSYETPGSSGVKLNTPTISREGTVYYATYAPATYLGVFALAPNMSSNWFFAAAAGNGGVVRTMALDANGNIFKTSGDGRVQGITPLGGALPWSSLPNSAYDESCPVIGTNGYLYYASGAYQFSEVDTVAGQIRYTWTGFLDTITAAPAIGSDGTIYVCTLGRVYALNPADRTMRQLYATPTGSSIRYSSPAVGPDGTLYIGTENGYFYAINGTTGALINRFAAGSKIHSSPAVAADGTVYFGTDAGDFVAVRLEGGVLVEKGRYYVGDKITCPVAMGRDGTVYVTDTGGFLWAFGGTTGPARSSWPMFHQNARRDGLAKAVPQVIRIDADPGTNVTEATTVTLTAVVTGSEPLDYVWGKDGVVLAGATTSQLVLANVQSSDSGLYGVIVANDAGEVMATVSVTVQGPPRPPVISVAPTNQTIFAGNPVQFQVKVEGTPPFAYQWFLNGAPLPGKTNAILAVTSATQQDVGAYSVTVSNVAGTTQTSQPAVLSLIDLRMFAGLIVTGQQGAKYKLEFANSLTQPVVWQAWKTVTLETAVQIFIDEDSPQHQQRFYRAILIP